MAIRTRDLKTETNLTDAVINMCIKNLLNSSHIKEVVQVHLKNRKHYIATEFEPSKEFTGGSWYVNVDLDTTFIDQLKALCLMIIRKFKVAMDDGVYDFFKANRLTNTECTSQQVSEILRSMVLDNMIIDVKSTGLGEYHSIPVGQVCYRRPPSDLNKGPKTGFWIRFLVGFVQESASAQRMDLFLRLPMFTTPNG
ncbi:putative RNA polymerase Rpc34, winged helix-like DNA-binding domain superfamily [Helianthus annuus]|nr:putative RNA polymerase Rpc34, winged helix-like DNA-binding domain superfamily [Helianthus annuus]